MGLGYIECLSVGRGLVRERRAYGHGGGRTVRRMRLVDGSGVTAESSVDTGRVTRAGGWYWRVGDSCTIVKARHHSGNSEASLNHNLTDTTRKKSEDEAPAQHPFHSTHY